MHYHGLSAGRIICLLITRRSSRGQSLRDGKHVSLSRRYKQLLPATIRERLQRVGDDQDR